MTHDPMHDVDGLTGALYDGTFGPCRLCEFAAKVRADERQICVSIVQTVGADHQNNAGRNAWRNEALVKLGYTGHI